MDDVGLSTSVDVDVVDVALGGRSVVAVVGWVLVRARSPPKLERTKHILHTQNRTDAPRSMRGR